MSQTILVPGCGPAYRMGYGCMFLSAGQNPPSRNEGISAIKSAVDAGVTLINTAYGYGPPGKPEANLELLSAFFAQYPKYRDEVILVVKIGIDVAKMQPTGKPEALRQHLEMALKALDGKKSIDILTLGRVPDDEPLEQVIQTFVTFKNEGHCKGIGMAEVSASTIRKASAIHPLSAVENEVSLFNLDTRGREALAACEELGIPLTSYSPLGKGFLTGKVKPEDHPMAAMLSRMPRFSGDNLNHNIALVSKLEQIADKKGIPTSQLALAFLLHLSPVLLPIPGSSKPERVASNSAAVNVQLTKDDLAEINDILESHPVAGDQYGEAQARLAMR